MKIELRQIIPSPLVELPAEDSQVWRRDVVFEAGRDYLISAASGKGKTSLVSILFGLRKDYSGQVYINNEDIRTYQQQKWTTLRRHTLALVPQGLCLFSHLSGLENIRIKNRLTNHFSESKIQDYLKICGLAEHKHKPAGILSYGQKQRIAIIRALCQPFEFIFLDEAFSHLDKANADIAGNLIKTEAAKHGAGILLTSLSPQAEGFETTLNL
jgi:ABC-type lipoprotein export system ATPase subunit